MFVIKKIFKKRQYIDLYLCGETKDKLFYVLNSLILSMQDKNFEIKCH